MNVQKIILIIAAILLSLNSFGGFFYERKHGKKRKLNREERSMIYLVSGVQWAVSGVIFIFGWNSFLDIPEQPGIILGLLLLLLAGVPLLFFWTEWIAYRLRKGARE